MCWVQEHVTEVRHIADPDDAFGTESKESFFSKWYICFKIVTMVKVSQTSIKCKYCDFSAADSAGMVNHLINVHKIMEKAKPKYICTICGHHTKTKSSLKMHEIFKHNIGVVWYPCDLCDYKAKQKGDVKIHKRNVHNIGVIWHNCPLCPYRAKQRGHLTRHFLCCASAREEANAENLHECHLCDYKICDIRKYKRHLNAHRRDIERVSRENAIDDVGFVSKEPGTALPTLAAAAIAIADAGDLKKSRAEKSHQKATNVAYQTTLGGSGVRL